MNDNNWKDCECIFSNGTEFEIFAWQCEKCTKYRNGKCRIYSAILKAMWDKKYFPFSDLLDRADGYGGKKCKSFSDEPTHRKRREPKQIEGQMRFSELIGERQNGD